MGQEATQKQQTCETLQVYTKALMHWIQLLKSNLNHPQTREYSVALDGLVTKIKCERVRLQGVISKPKRQNDPPATLSKRRQ